MVDYETKKRTVEQYEQAFIDKDIAIIKNLYADDAVVEDPVGSEPMQGIDAIVEFYERGFSMGVTIKLNGPVRGAASAAAFPFTVNMPGMAIDVIDVFEFNEAGKVTSMKAYWGAENSRTE